MTVIFCRGRMHAGNRMKDWSDVWLELDVPKGDQEKETLNADREYDFELYSAKFKTGDEDGREPDVSEVVWHSHFDVATFPAKTKQMRERMQKQFLSDAWLYLSAKDAKKVRNLEQQLDQPDYARWQSWFRLAKKYKRSRKRNLRNGIDDDNDDDDNDSAYDDGEDRTGNDAPMGPPPRPRKPKKRKAAGHEPPTKVSKNSKLGIDRGQRRLSFDREGTVPRMSGGLGNMLQDDGVDGADNGDFEDQIYDPSPPEGVEDIINGNDPNNIRSPFGPRDRGYSRSPVNNWQQNQNAREHLDSGRNSIEDDVENTRRLKEINGDMDEDKAFDEAMRQSVGPT